LLIEEDMLTWTEFTIYVSLVGAFFTGGLWLLSWHLDWWSPRVPVRARSRRVSD